MSLIQRNYWLAGAVICAVLCVLSYVQGSRDGLARRAQIAPRAIDDRLDKAASPITSAPPPPGTGVERESKRSIPSKDADAVDDGVHTQLKADLVEFRRAIERDRKPQLVATWMERLQQKYAGDHFALACLLEKEANIARDLFDRRTEEERLEAALIELSALRVVAQLKEAELLVSLGECEYSAGKSEEALAHFRQLLEATMPENAARNQIAAWQDSYNIAARRAVARTPVDKLGELYALPFSRDEISKRFPDRAELLARRSLDQIKYMRSIILWLKHSLAGMPIGDPRRPHYEAVLKHAEESFRDNGPHVAPGRLSSRG